MDHEEELMTMWESRERVRPLGNCWSGGWMVQAWWNLVQGARFDGWSKLVGTWYKERVLMAGPSLV